MLHRTPLLVLLITLSVVGCKKHHEKEALKVPHSGLITPSMLPKDQADVRAQLDGPDAPALIITAGLDGYTEPCGCTEDILKGGIDRLVGTVLGVDAQQDKPTLFVSAGDTLFGFANAPDAKADQDDARLKVLQAGLQRADVRILGVGPRDLSRGWKVFDTFARRAGATVVSTNLHPKDHADDEAAAWQPSKIQTLGDFTIAFLNVVLPGALENSPAADTLTLRDPTTALTAELAQPAVHNADVRVLFAHGETDALASLVSALDDVDFVIVGQTDDANNSVDDWGHAAALRVRSQGRQIGTLRLSPKAKDGSTPNSDNTDEVTGNVEAAHWVNARTLSSKDVQTLHDLIAHLDEQIQAVQSRASGDEPPAIVKTLQDRRNSYKSQLKSAKSQDNVQFSGDATQFLWNTVALSPGLPEDPQTTAARKAYNRQLQEINLQNATPPEPTKDGVPHFVGVQTCQKCHTSEHTFWENTPHAHAYQDLIDRDKNFDLECVGCHVTGYQQPGGSTLGFTDNLKNVQCEACHGPGSMHAQNPTLIGGETGVHRTVEAATCKTCHTHEHSPTFDYDAYLPRIVGKGHERARTTP